MKPLDLFATIIIILSVMFLVFKFDRQSKTFTACRADIAEEIIGDNCPQEVQELQISNLYLKSELEGQ